MTRVFNEIHSPLLDQHQTVPSQNLWRLALIRWFMLLSLLVGATLYKTLVFSGFPLLNVLLIAGAMAVVTILTHVRMQKSRPLREFEFAAQILVDVVGISLVFYFLGGATNPFVSFYLVPLAIAAATLSWPYVAVLALCSVSAYSLLLFFYQPLLVLEPSVHQHGAALTNAESNLHPHTLGMWFNFIMSAGLICFFVVRMALALKERERELSQKREETLRDEQILAVATLAAGTAHELGTPLTTMKVLVNELIAEHGGNRTLLPDLQQLDTQIKTCRETLKKLVSQSESVKQDAGQPIDVTQYCKNIFSQWQLIRPDVNVDLQMETLPSVFVNFHPTVDQAILNVLNNAADASPDKVAVAVQIQNKHLCIAITDTGSGVGRDIKSALGQNIVTTKEQGLGLGVLLSNATLNRYGGSLRFRNTREGGTLTEIELPLSEPENL